VPQFRAVFWVALLVNALQAAKALGGVMKTQKNPAAIKNTHRRALPEQKRNAESSSFSQRLKSGFAPAEGANEGIS
jgi:hypothetical protein